MPLPRPHMSVSTKLQACLILLGFAPGERVDWDHFPALGLRDFDEATGKYTPDANDPKFIRPLGYDDHKRKTFGNGATTRGSDLGEIAKTRHLTKAEVAFRSRLLAKEPGKPREKSGKIRSRGFEGKFRPFRRTG